MERQYKKTAIEIWEDKRNKIDRIKLNKCCGVEPVFDNDNGSTICYYRIFCPCCNKSTKENDDLLEVKQVWNRIK